MQAATVTHLPKPVAASSWLLAVPLALLTFTALVIATRRLAGAFVQPLSASTMLLAGVLAAAAAAGVHLLTRRISTSHSPRWAEQALDWWPTAAVVVFGLSLSLPQSGIWGLSLLWTALMTEELAVRWAPRLTRRRIAVAPPREPAVPAAKDPRVEQHLTRSRTAEGGECIQGWLRATFAAGQRTAISHIAFCPPLAGQPKFDCTQTDGPPVRVKVAQLVPQGSRLELKLAEPAEDETHVLLEFRAEAGE